MRPRITVYEVGPRDGLQNEARHVPSGDKLHLIQLLADAGLSRIEAASFVSPSWVPAMGDAEEVVARLPRRAGLTYVALVPNARGLERMLRALASAGLEAARVDAAVFLSASDSHNRRNLSRSVEESLSELEALVPAALARGLQVRAYLSTAWACPYEGAIAPDRVRAITERLLALGCYQVSLGDTIGVGTPGQTRCLVELLLSRVDPERIALHMHDTYGTALANVLVGLQAGLTTFDSSIGGMGGCPYAPGASGNLATEDLVYLLHGMGYETGIDWPLLVAAGEQAQRLAGHRLPGKALQAEIGKRVAQAGAGKDPSG